MAAIKRFPVSNKERKVKNSGLQGYGSDHADKIIQQAKTDRATLLRVELDP